MANKLIEQAQKSRLLSMQPYKERLLMMNPNWNLGYTLQLSPQKPNQNKMPPLPLSDLAYL